MRRRGRDKVTVHGARVCRVGIEVTILAMAITTVTLTRAGGCYAQLTQQCALQRGRGEVALQEYRVCDTCTNVEQVESDDVAVVSGALAYDLTPASWTAAQINHRTCALSAEQAIPVIEVSQLQRAASHVPLSARLTNKCVICLLL